MVHFDHSSPRGRFERQFAGNCVGVLARRINIGKIGAIYVRDGVCVAQVKIVHRHRDFSFPARG
jgi:hypothetical protein